MGSLVLEGPSRLFHRDRCVRVFLAISAPTGLNHTLMQHDRCWRLPVLGHLKHTHAFTHKSARLHTSRFVWETHFNLLSCRSAAFSLRDVCLTATLRGLFNSEVRPHFQPHCVWTDGTHTQTLPSTPEWPRGAADARRQLNLLKYLHTHSLSFPNYGVLRHSSTPSVFA